MWHSENLTKIHANFTLPLEKNGANIHSALLQGGVFLQHWERGNVQQAPSLFGSLLPYSAVQSSYGPIMGPVEQDTEGNAKV